MEPPQYDGGFVAFKSESILPNFTPIKKDRKR
jgi:hypothetical protein